MIAEGMTQREIAKHFGFKSKKLVHEALTRARRKETQLPKVRGRKPAKTLVLFLGKIVDIEGVFASFLKIVDVFPNHILCDPVNAINL